MRPTRRALPFHAGVQTRARAKGWRDWRRQSVEQNLRRQTRASKRLARLAQAISRTKLAAPNSIRYVERTSLILLSSIVVARSLYPSFSAGLALIISWAMTASCESV